MDNYPSMTPVTLFSEALYIVYDSQEMPSKKVVIVYESQEVPSEKKL